LSPVLSGALFSTLSPTLLSPSALLSPALPPALSGAPATGGTSSGFCSDSASVVVVVSFSAMLGSRGAQGLAVPAEKETSNTNLGRGEKERNKMRGQTGGACSTVPWTPNKRIPENWARFNKSTSQK